MLIRFSVPLTTLAERRIRGDLIETFKILNDLVEYGDSIFTVGRSGYKILSRPSKSNNRDIKKAVNSFLPQRVIRYWNKLPIEIKCSESVLNFKINLESYKLNCKMTDADNFWEVSTTIIDKIETESYLLNRSSQVEYLKSNPYIAKKKGINI